MISDMFESYMAYINEISGGNEFMASAIFLSSVGIASFILKDVPKKIFLFTKRHVVTTMSLNNGGWYQENVMHNLAKWLEPRMRESLSRTLSVQSSFEEEHGSISVGYGFHLFFYNKRLFWLRKEKLESSGSERQKEEVVIGTFGRSHEPFKQIIRDFTPKRDDNKLSLYHLDSKDGWMRYSDVPKRPLNTVAMGSSTKGEIVDQIRHMKDNPNWFYSKGLPYKLAYIFHGKPGGGKTSLIKAIASEFGMNICIININQIDDNSLEKGLAQLPKNSVVIIEDFDSSNATKSRDDGGGKQTSGPFEDFIPLTLTGLLNALDGVNPLDDCILFMTTNHLSRVDPALYRKGRVDHIIEVGEIDRSCILDYCNVIFPEHDFSKYNFNPVMGNVLNQALMEGKDNPEIFARCIERGGSEL